MTSCWAAYAISISRCVVMPLFMWRGLLSQDFRLMVADRGDDSPPARLGILLPVILSRGISLSGVGSPILPSGWIRRCGQRRIWVMAEGDNSELSRFARGGRGQRSR